MNLRILMLGALVCLFTLGMAVQENPPASSDQKLLADCPCKHRKKDKKENILWCDDCLACQECGGDKVEDKGEDKAEV